MAVTHDVKVKMKALNDLKNVDKEIEQKLKLRQKANKEILNIIENIVNDNSQLRFCQILTILGLDNDNFNEESVDTLARIKEKIAELEDRVMRQMAEFENFRKRTEKEKSMMFDMGAKNIIEKILPVVDNFERGLATIPEEDEKHYLKHFAIIIGIMLNLVFFIGIELVIIIF